MLSDKPFEVPADLLAKMRGVPPVRMAVAGIESPEVMESVRLSIEAKVMEPLLVGEPGRIRDLARQAGWSADGLAIHAADGEEVASATAVRLVREGAAQAILKGDLHTSTLLKAVLNRESGLRAGRRLNHVFHMSVPGSARPLYIADAVINVAPDRDTLCDIIINAARMVHSLGVARPKVAVLSASEVVSEAMPSTVLARDAAAMAAEALVGIADVQGPLAFDLAVSPKAAAHKRVDGPVAGQADVLVVPNIETGNALFKMMVYFMSATAAGLVMGAACPIGLTSRADPPQARLASSMMCAILAHRAAASA